MTADLRRFLAGQKHVSQGTATWPNGIELEIAGYFCVENPPLELVSSVRAIVLREDHVLVMRNLDGTHIVPGGRVEEGETHEETLRRELVEEAGVEIEVGTRIGLVHLRHTTPRPKDHPYPYPDFLWPVYVASFVSDVPHARVEDDYETSSRFMSVHDVRGLVLDGYEKAFLEAAVSANLMRPG